MANQAEDHRAGGHHTPYFVIWIALLAMTLVALGAGYFPMPESIKAIVLVSVTLAKIAVIAIYFMHLKTEKRDLWILTFSPLILAVIMFAFTYGEVNGSDTHVLMVRPAHKAAPAVHGAAPAEHAEH